MYPGAHGYVFCFLLTIFPLVQGFCFGKIKALVSAKNGFVKGGPDIKESSNVRLKPAFEIQNSALQYFLAAENFQQKTTAELAAHISVVEMAFFFWKFGRSWRELRVHANYGGFEEFGKNKPWFTEAVNNISSVGLEGRLFGRSTNSLKELVILTPEKKSG